MNRFWFGSILVLCIVYLLNVEVFQKYTELIQPAEFIQRPEARFLNEYSGVENKNSESCQYSPIDGISHGIKIDPTGKTAYYIVSDADERAMFYPPAGRLNASFSTGQDRINVLDLDSNSVEELEIFDYNEDFVAGALDVRVDSHDPNSRLLYIINHKPDHAVVSVFNHTIGSLEARHVYDVKDNIINTPSDLVAVSEEAIYFTNDHLFRSGRLRTFEDQYGPWKWASAVYCSFDFEDDGILEDEEGSIAPLILNSAPYCRPVAHGLSEASSIEFDVTTNITFIADSKLGEVKIYKRGERHLLNLLKTVYLGTSPKSLKLLANKDLIVATNTNYESHFNRTQELGNSLFASPSAVLLLRASEHYETPHLLFADNKAEHSGVISVEYATSLNKMFFVSGIESSIKSCTVPL